MAFQPGLGRAAVPARAAIAGIIAALAAVLAALVFTSSLSHVIGDPAVVGWDWDVTVGNPHSGDVYQEAVPQLRADNFVSDGAHPPQAAVPRLRATRHPAA